MSDVFPADGTQWNDTDGDGHGDNPYGTEAIGSQMTQHVGRIVIVMA